MRHGHHLWLQMQWTVFLVLLLLLTPGATRAEAPIVAQLTPIGASGVTGEVALDAAGDTTHVTLSVTGLAPLTEARATLHALTCEMPSGSFVALPNLVVDATGGAMAEGNLRFHDEPLALSVIADGEHVVFVHEAGQPVACGSIPALGELPAVSVLPASGTALLPTFSEGVALLGLCGLLSGVRLRVANSRDIGGHR